MSFVGYKHTPEAIEKIRQAGTGRTHTEEVRKKMSERMMGNKITLGLKHTLETLKKMSDVKIGKKFSDESKRKMSEAVKKRLANGMPEETKRKISIANGGNGVSPYTGKNCYHRKDIQYKEWRSAVFTRDDWTCQTCGERSGTGKQIYLEPHHIKGWAKYKELRYELLNGITLCRECHKQTHKKRK